MAFPFSKKLEDITAAFPDDVYTPHDFRTENRAGEEIVDEPFTVPSEPDAEGRYRLNLNQVPIEMATFNLRVATVAREHVPYGESIAVGRVGVSTRYGFMEFNAADAGASGLVSYRGAGTPIVAHLLNVIGAELKATQETIKEGAAPLPPGLGGARSGAVIYVDANASYTGDAAGDGSELRPFATLGAAISAIADSADSAFLVRLAPGSYVWDCGADDVVPSTKLVWLDGGESGATVTIEGYSEAVGVPDSEPPEFDYISRVHVAGWRNINWALDMGDATTLEFPEPTGAGFRRFIGGTMDLDLTVGLVSFSGAGGGEMLGVAISMGGASLSLQIGNLALREGCSITGGGAVVVGSVASGVVISAVSVNVTVGDAGEVRGAKLIATGAITLGGARFRDSIIVAGDSGISLVLLSDLLGCGIETSGHLNIRVDEDADGEVVIAGNRIRAAGAEVNTLNPGLINLLNLADCERVIIEDNDVEYTGKWSENTEGGRVCFILRMNTPCPVRVRRNRFRGNIIGIMNSHPIADAGQNSFDQPLEVAHNVFDIGFVDESGDEPNDPAVALWHAGRGAVLSTGNLYRVNASAAVEGLPTRSYGCVMLWDDHSAGVATFESFADALVLIGPDDEISSDRAVSPIVLEGRGSGTVVARFVGTTIHEGANVRATVGQDWITATSIVPVLSAVCSNKTVTTDRCTVTLEDGTGLLRSKNLEDLASAATARTNLGVGTGDSPSFAGVQATTAKWVDITGHLLGPTNTSVWNYDDNGYLVFQSSDVVTFAIPAVAGTKLAAVRVKFEAEFDDDCQINVYMRDDSTASASTLSEIGDGVQVFSEDSPERLFATYTLPSVETTVEGTVYLVRVTITAGSGPARVYSVQAQFTERAL